LEFSEAGISIRGYSGMTSQWGMTKTRHLEGGGFLLKAQLALSYLTALLATLAALAGQSEL
jgi:hypothetical protein